MPKLTDNISDPVIDKNEEPTKSLSEVIFPDVQNYYDADEEVKIKYAMQEKASPNSGDWIGLFPSGWQTINQYVTFQWAQPLRQVDDSRTKGDTFVRFSASHLFHCTDEHSYQVLYVNQQNQILGASKPFTFIRLSGRSQQLSTLQHYDTNSSDYGEKLQAQRMTSIDCESSLEQINSTSEENGIECLCLNEKGSKQLSETQDEPELQDDPGTKKVRFLVQAVLGTLEEQVESPVFPDSHTNKIVSGIEFSDNEDEKNKEKEGGGSDSDMKKVRFLVESVPASIHEEPKEKLTSELQNLEIKTKEEYQPKIVDEEIHRNEVLDEDINKNDDCTMQVQHLMEGKDEEQIKDQWIEDQITELNTIKNRLMTWVCEEDIDTCNNRSQEHMRTQDMNISDKQKRSEAEVITNFTVTSASSVPVLVNERSICPRVLEIWNDIINNEGNSTQEKQAQTSKHGIAAKSFYTNEEIHTINPLFTAKGKHTSWDAEKFATASIDANTQTECDQLFTFRSKSDRTQTQWDSLPAGSYESGVAIIEDFSMDSLKPQEEILIVSSEDEQNSCCSAGEGRNGSPVVTKQQTYSHVQESPSPSRELYQKISQMERQIQKLKIQRSALKMFHEAARDENCELGRMVIGLQNTLNVAEEQLQGILRDKEATCVTEDNENHFTFLSDLLYTLSVRGFISVTTRDGEKVDLCNCVGVLLEVEGTDGSSLKKGQRSSSREKMFLKAVVGSQENSIQRLVEQLNQTQTTEEPWDLVKRLHEELGIEQERSDDLLGQVEELQEKLECVNRREKQLMQVVRDNKNFIRETMQQVWPKSTMVRSDGNLHGADTREETSVSLPLLVQPKDSLVLYREPHSKATRASEPVIKTKRAALQKEALSQNFKQYVEKLSRTQSENQSRYVPTTTSQSSSGIHRRTHSKTKIPALPDITAEERPKSPILGHREDRANEDRQSHKWKQVHLEDEATASKVAVALACPWCHQVFSAATSTGEMKSHMKKHKHHETE